MIMSNNSTPNPDQLDLKLNTTGEKVKIHTLKIHELRSMYA